MRGKRTAAQQTAAEGACQEEDDSVASPLAGCPTLPYAEIMNLRYLFCASILLIVAVRGAPALAQPAEPGPVQDGYPKNWGIDMLHYAFALQLSDDTDTITGQATIEARYLAPGQSTLRLDLIKESEALDGKGMTVDRVHNGGEDLPFRHEDDQIFVELGREVAPQERIQVTVEYHGIPATGLKIGPTKHGDRSFFSDNWSSRAKNWLPTVDHPYDKASNELIVTAPDHYQVISNGLLVEETDLSGGLRRTHWNNSIPIATWLYVLGVAEFAVQYVDTFDGKSIQTWVYKQDRDAGFYDFAVVTEFRLEVFRPHRSHIFACDRHHWYAGKLPGVDVAEYPNGICIVSVTRSPRTP